MALTFWLLGGQDTAFTFWMLESSRHCGFCICIVINVSDSNVLYSTCIEIKV